MKMLGNTKPISSPFSVLKSPISSPFGMRFKLPTVVLDGLQLYVDAGNILSYPTTGTTWTDLSGNGNNGTLSNCTYDSSDSGSIVFNGSSSIVAFSGAGSVNLSTAMTASVWVYYVGGNTRIFQKDSPVNTRIWEMGVFAGQFRAEMWHSSGTGTLVYGTSLAVNKWTNLTLTFDGTNVLMYQNGVLVTTVNFPGNIRTATATPIYLGGYWSGGEYLNGKISNAQLYNRALSTTEVAQNFNALRERFKIPWSWFAAGEQGAWYDPSDITTLFQDSAGTTPMSAVGTVADQPVGLMRDKSGRGNHAFQATAGNRPMLSARVNLLLATATLSTQSVTSLATNYTLSFTGTGTVTLSGTATGVLSAGSNTFTATAGTLTLTVSGSVTLADLRPTNSGALLPPYQRVNTATDYDTVGFPLYLKCNGSSSAMSTNSINFTATDKMTVVTGVRKLSDATRGMIGELSSSLDTNNGSFNISGSFPNATANYRYESKGTLVSSVDCGTGYIAPINNVLTTQSYIATDSDSMRVNGTLVATSPADQGAGNFGNYPFYLFARAGTSLFLNGQFYGAIIRGAQSDTASITQTENYMATKTGITF